MIKGNVLYFGLGDILVGNDAATDPLCHVVRFANIKPPQKIGDSRASFESDVKVGKCIHIYFDRDFNIDRESITELNPVFEYHGYTFDFSKYNRRSVDILFNAIDKALSNNMYPLAC